MIQIRNEVFETNSSSSHSIVILKNKRFDKNFTKNEIESGFWVNNGKVKVYHGDIVFGIYPFHVISSFKEKVLYCIAYFCGKYHSSIEAESIYREIIEIVRENVEGFVDFDWPVIEYWGEDSKEEEFDMGDIDHQSRNLLGNMLSSEGIGIREFLLNKKYLIIIDGDGYNEFINLVDSGLINKSVFEKVYSASSYIRLNKESEL